MKDDRSEKFIAEKSNGSDGLNDVDMLLSLGQVYKPEDDVFRNSNISKSGIGMTLLCQCNMVGLLKVDDGCGIVNTEGVVWRCGFIMAVRYCVFTVVSWHCKLGGRAVMGWICVLATTIVVCGLVMAIISLV